MNYSNKKSEKVYASEEGVAFLLDFILIQVTTFILSICFWIVADVYHYLGRKTQKRLSKRRYQHLTLAWRCFALSYFIQFIRNFRKVAFELWHIWSFKLATSIGAVGIGFLFMFLASFFENKYLNTIFWSMGGITGLFTVFGLVTRGYRVVSSRFGVLILVPSLVGITSFLLVLLLIFSFTVTGILLSLKDIHSHMKKRIQYMCISYIVFWSIGVFEGSLVVFYWGTLGILVLRILFLIAAFPTILLWVGRRKFINALKSLIEGVCFGVRERKMEKETGSQSILTDFLFEKPSKTSPREIRKQKKRLRHLLDSLPGVIYRCSYDQLWTMQYVSEGIRKLTGYTPEEIQNNKKVSFTRLIHAEDREKVKRKIKTAIKRKKPYQLTYRLITAEGRQKWVWEQGRGIYTENGSVEELIGFILDVTPRKRAKEKIEALHKWSRHLVDAETIEEVANYTLDAMKKTLGFKKATFQVKKENILKTIAYRGYEQLPQELEQFPLDGPGITVKVATTGKSELLHNVENHSQYFSVSKGLQSELAVPMKTENEILGVLNVESEKKSAFTLQDKRLLELLATNVAVAVKKLREREKRVSLQRLDKLRDEFLAMAGHEINTPITPLRTGLEMLSREYWGDLNPKQKKEIDHLLESLERLERLVKDFQRISKLRTGKFPLNIEEHYLSTTVEKAIEKYKDFIQEEGITVKKDLEQPLITRYDEDRIIQVIRNLFENAIDYTEDTIWVRAWTEKDTIHLAIEDNGLGIPKKEQSKIFKPFYRLKKEQSQLKQRFGGTGLGLNICKRIMEAHNGKISIKSEVGEGSTFIITLP